MPPPDADPRLAFLPAHAFTALPVVLTRPGSTWDEPGDVGTYDEPGAEPDEVSPLDERDEFSPIVGEE